MGFLIKPMPEFVRSKPKQLPWGSQGTASIAAKTNIQTNYQYLDNGQLLIEISHAPLIDITPKMLHWFYQHLPVSSVQLGSQTIPWYQILHTYEHNLMTVLEPKNINTKALTNKNITAELLHKEEWFGPYNSQGDERVISMSEQGIIVNLELAGLTFGEIHHNFAQIPEGTQYKVNAIIGSDLPIISPIINLIIRYKLFPEPMIKHWIKHQVEEVNNLNAFLPQLYIAPKQGEHYQLALTETETSEP